MADFDDFDPATELETPQDADRYVQWCAYQLGLHEGCQPRTMIHARMAAIFLWAVASAQLHLDDDIEVEREPLEQRLGVLFTHARRIERRPDEASRAALQAALVLADAWEPVGRYADRLLGALRHAIAAVVVAEMHPLQLKDDLPGEHCWVLVDSGVALLNEIQDADYPDYSVQPSAKVIDRMGWQRARGISQRLGGPPPSQN